MIYQESQNVLSSTDEVISATSEYVKLFVGQIPKEITEDSLKELFEEFGPVVELTIIRDNMTMISKGCAFVTYFYQDSAKEAIENLHDKIKLPNSLNTLQVRIAESQVERENKLFIGMLPKAIDDHDLHQMFVSYGELREVHVIKGMDGSPKGCAFVKFADRNAALAAIEDLNGTIPPGATRAIVVKFADSKKQGKVTDYWEQAGSQVNTVNAMFSYPQSSAQQQILGMPYMTYSGSNQIPSPPMPINMPLSPNVHQQHPQRARVMYVQNQMGYYNQTSPNSSSYNVAPVSDFSHVDHPGRQSINQNNAFIKSNNQTANNYSQNNDTVGINQPAAGLSQAYNEELSSVVDPDQNGSRPPEGPSGANLFIYHLPRDLIDADLATLFAPFGNVISAKVFVDKKTSDSKGFGFVSYDTLDSANAAIESMNGFQIGTKRLKVQHKRTVDASDNFIPASHHEFNNDNNYNYNVNSNAYYDNYFNSRGSSNTGPINYQQMMGSSGTVGPMNNGQIYNNIPANNGQMYSNIPGNHPKQNMYGNYTRPQQYYGNNRNQY